MIDVMQAYRGATWIDGVTLHPDDSLPIDLVDAAAKDACAGLAKEANPLPGENEKAESYFVAQSLDQVAAKGTIPAADLDVRTDQARAIVIAAESTYCKPSVPTP